MKKILDFIKKYFIGIIAIIIVIIIALVLIFRVNQEKELTNTLKEMGIDFYENFYYINAGENLKERSAFLKKYEDIGVKINLDNLSKYNSEENTKKLEQFKNNKTNKTCDINSTEVVIYPKEPFNKNNYEIEVILDCGFDD